MYDCKMYCLLCHLEIIYNAASPPGDFHQQFCQSFETREDDTTFSTYEDGGGEVSKGAGAEMP